MAIGTVWTIIRCNLCDEGLAKAFNHWYNTQHAPRYIAQPGFARGWRLERLEHTATRGKPGQRYLAIYETESTDAFNSALERDFADGHPWEEWEARVKDWQRTYYLKLLSFGDALPSGPNKGQFWSIVRVDLHGLGEAEERKFNLWYDTIHVPEVCRLSGFRRAWRLKLQPDERDLGPRGQKYLAIYETDDPDYLPSARRGKVPWDGVWLGHIQNWEIGIYHKVYDHEQGGVNG